MASNYSRPIRITASDLTAGKATLLGRSTRVASISVTALGNDVNVIFKNGAAGEAMWDIEADNASGTHTVSFGCYPLLCTMGLAVEVDIPANLKALSVTVVEPRSAGTA